MAWDFSHVPARVDNMLDQESTLEHEGDVRRTKVKREADTCMSLRLFYLFFGIMSEILTREEEIEENTKVQLWPWPHRHKRHVLRMLLAH